mgnify:CR=1 FL=1
MVRKTTSSKSAAKEGWREEACDAQGWCSRLVAPGQGCARARGNRPRSRPSVCEGRFGQGQPGKENAGQGCRRRCRVKPSVGQAFWPRRRPQPGLSRPSRHAARQAAACPRRWPLKAAMVAPAARRRSPSACAGCRRPCPSTRRPGDHRLRLRQPQGGRGQGCAGTSAGGGRQQEARATSGTASRPTSGSSIRRTASAASSASRSRRSPACRWSSSSSPSRRTR